MKPTTGCCATSLPAPAASQRQLATELGISLGKLNYCLQALIGKGWVKAGNFSRSSKKGYAYLLTPSGFETKARRTIAFLQHRVAEYDQLQQGIETLRQEVHTPWQKPADGAESLQVPDSPCGPLSAKKDSGE